MGYNNKPKPDDRSDNVEKLQDMIQNTKENIEKAEATMDFSDTDQQQIEAKNERRRASIEGMQAEIEDETAARHNSYE